VNMVIPNEGKPLLLGWLFRDDGTGLEDFILDLYSNDYTPVDGSTGASFTAATFGGYAQLDILRSEFDAPAVVANVAEIVRTPPPAWTQTSGADQIVYGWYLRGVDSGEVVAAQRFDTPRTMSVGATETLDPFKIKLKTFT